MYNKRYKVKLLKNYGSFIELGLATNCQKINSFIKDNISIKFLDCTYITSDCTYITSSQVIKIQ